ncbi:MAG: KpsF/GutQ family sugar-phosphate isomerase [Mesorhizobium sp.]|nr:MAG: KpsF/GutQ family sugar-phosphate isomerase [Mesorhizobium sp.]
MEAFVMAIVSQGPTAVPPGGEPAQRYTDCGSDHSNSKMAMLERARAIIRHEAAALETLSNRIDEHICTLSDHILSSTGTVVVCGVGKSRLVGERISAILTSTGTRSITLDPVDGLHGDLGRVCAGDVILALSNSGKTAELLQLVRAVRQIPVMVAAITGRATSPLAQAADMVLDIGPMREACALGLAPTTSMTAMAAMGDALALVLQERRGFTREDFAHLHPGGSLGRELMRVRDLMWPLESMPVVRPNTSLSLALLSMCRAPQKLGVAVVVGERCKVTGILIGESIGRLVERGAIPDLDDPVERHMQQPASISWDAFVNQAEQLFRQHEIELMAVHDDQDKFVGLICRQEFLKPS